MSLSCWAGWASCLSTTPSFLPKRKEYRFHSPRAPSRSERLEQRQLHQHHDRTWNSWFFPWRLASSSLFNFFYEPSGSPLAQSDKSTHWSNVLNPRSTFLRSEQHPPPSPSLLSRVSLPQWLSSSLSLLDRWPCLLNFNDQALYGPNGAGCHGVEIRAQRPVGCVRHRHSDIQYLYLPVPRHHMRPMCFSMFIQHLVRRARIRLHRRKQPDGLHERAPPSVLRP